MASSSSARRVAQKSLKNPFPNNRRQLQKWFDKMSAAFYKYHDVFPSQAFDLATVKMQGLLRENQPDYEWNASADDEFQRLKEMNKVIYENKVEQSTLKYKSCGSSTLIVNLSDLKGDD